MSPRSPSASSWHETTSSVSSSPVSLLPFKANFSTKFQSTWMAWRWRCPWNDSRTNFNSYSIPGLIFVCTYRVSNKNKIWGPSLETLFWTTLGHPCYIGPFGPLWASTTFGNLGPKIWPLNKALKILLTTFLGTPFICLLFMPLFQKNLPNHRSHLRAVILDWL